MASDDVWGTITGSVDVQLAIKKAFGVCLVFHTSQEFVEGVAAFILAVLIIDFEIDWKGAAVAALEWSNCSVRPLMMHLGIGSYLRKVARMGISPFIALMCSDWQIDWDEFE